MTTNYRASNNEKELEMIPVINNNDSINIVSDPNSDESEKDIENNDSNFFDEDIKQVKETPQNHYQLKSGMSNEKATSCLQ